MRFLVVALLSAAVLAGCGSSDRTQQQTRSATAGTSTSSATSGGRSATAAAYVAPVTVIELVPPMAKYSVYVDRLLAVLRTQVAKLHSATGGAGLRAAERDWRRAHVTWLELGQDDDAYGAFGDLGEQIDGLAAGLPGTVHNQNFTGFHRVELDLWGRHDSAAAAVDSAHLLKLVAKLTPTLVQHDLALTATSLDGWVLRCHEILEDALRDSLTENDDYGSNSDLGSLAADAKATHEMLTVLGPAIRARSPQIVPDATAELHTLAHAIAGAGGAAANRNLRTLPLRKRQALDAATSAATETLAPVSEILQIAVVGS